VKLPAEGFHDSLPRKNKGTMKDHLVSPHHAIYWRFDGDLSWSARPGRDQYITERHQPEVTTTRCSGRLCHLAPTQSLRPHRQAWAFDAGWPRNPSAIEMQHGADGRFQTYGLCESVSLSATRRLALRTARTASRTWLRESSSFSSRNYLGRPTILISRLGFTREH
jgi:hypothetical protein